MKKKVLPIVIALLLAVSLLACGGKKGTASVTVTFDTNGGSAVDAQTIDKGAAATVPAEPEKDNFDFVDWFSDAALTAVYDFAAAVDSNITLYAKWEAFDPATATTTWTTLTVSDTTIKITQYTGTARDVIVPAEIDGKAVVSLQINTFRDFVKVTSISIPASVTRLGENGTATQPADVFKGTDKLRAVTVDPENTVYSSCDGIVYSIYDAYKAPTANKQTTMEFIPARVEAVVVPAATKVAGNAFLSARNLDTITVEEGNTVYSAENNVLYETYPGIPNGVLAKVANHITAVTIPERVKRISSFAFSYCDKLKSVTIPETLGGYNNAQGLTPSAFENCLSLESIVIEPVLEGSGVIGRVMDTLPNSVFAGCKNLKSLSYPAAVASIDAAAFRDCAKLESIYISDKVVSVGFYCFSGCASLTIRCGYAYAGGDIPKPNQWRPYTYWSDTWNSDDRPVVWGAQA